MPGIPPLRWLAGLDRRLLWHVPGAADTVFLTFDDGPEPAITPWVLDTLAAHGAKASFFCLGRNAEHHPGLLARIRAEGHAVGHHSWDHANGWYTPPRTWLRSVLHGAQSVGGPLFRPPYGRIRPAHIGLLHRRFHVVMWDVMAGDFRPGRSGQDCARHVLRQSRPGSIIVLHDNLKSAACLREALVPILEGFSQKGWRCSALGHTGTGR
jgi:peptidoglycan/xylan/chitin deacetylase (PgdA/CDA1 family)